MEWETSEKEVKKEGEEIMGRAIDMEKDIDVLKKEIGELKDILNEILQGVKDDKKETKKTDTKRSKKSRGNSTARPSDSEQ